MSKLTAEKLSKAIELINTSKPHKNNVEEPFWVVVRGELIQVTEENIRGEFGQEIKKVLKEIWDDENPK